MKNYELRFLDKVIGNVRVKVVGLYTEFYCLCTLPKGQFFRVVADYSGEIISLGICIWEDNQYRCFRKLPTKRLGEGQPVFRVVSAEKSVYSCDCIAVDTEKPFPEINRLPLGQAMIEQGTAKIFFVEQIS